MSVCMCDWPKRYWPAKKVRAQKRMSMSVALEEG